jgi:hypothetical protein
VSPGAKALLIATCGRIAEQSQSEKPGLGVPSQAQDMLCGEEFDSDLEGTKWEK